MKQTIITIIALVLTSLSAPCQSVGGKVVDEFGEGVPYAGVLLKSTADSSTISGTLADVEGRFSIDRYADDSFIEASSVGYKTARIPAVASAELIITLALDSELLDAAVFRAEIPKVRLEGGALVTRVKNSMLENVGNATDVLARVPGMMRQGEQLSVIGKGQPVYYINGRKVLDESELKRLQSQDIREVEVISNPGAAYAADAHAVVRIRTVMNSEEGFSGSANLSDAQTLRFGSNLLAGDFSLGYRYHDFDITLGAHLAEDRLNHSSFTLDQTSITEHVFNQHGPMEFDGLQTRGALSLGASYLINEDNSIGVRVERTANLRSVFHEVMTDIVTVDGQLTDELESYRTDDQGDDYSLLANAYWDGKLKSLSINLNADYYQSSEDILSAISERSYAGLSEFGSRNSSANRMYAAKLVLAHPLWGGNLQAGSEASHIRRDNDYRIENEHIRDSKSDASEKNLAGFAEYSRMIPYAGILTAGLRYEWTSFVYNIDGKEEVNRIYGDFYPNISFATQIGELQAVIDYNIKTRRPNYNDLRSGIEYSSRFTLRSGNPTLKNETTRSLRLALNRKWLSFSAGYQKRFNAIYDWARPYDEQGTVIINMVNFDKPLIWYDAFLVAAPTFGCFSTNNVIGVQAQDISFTLDDPGAAGGKREVRYNRPMFIFNSNNSFRLKNDWQLELNSEFYSKADFGNASLQNNYWDLNLAVQKSFLRNKNLVLRLSCGDLFQTAKHDVSIDLGNYKLYQSDINGQSRTLYEMHRATLTLKYSFNARNSSYRGKGAAGDMLERLK